MAERYIDIVPSSTDYTESTLVELTNQRDHLIEDGFHGVHVFIPTRGFPGTRTEAYLDLDKDDHPLPFLPSTHEYNRLVVSTLSGISIDATLQDKNKDRYSYGWQQLGHIAIDSGVQKALVKIAELANDLALEGYGYSEEQNWIKPMEPVGETIRISSSNTTRYYVGLKLLESEFSKRKAEWKEKGWMYVTDWGSDETPAHVSLMRWLDYNDEESSIDNVLQVIDCDEKLIIEAHLSPDFGPRCNIEPIGPLTLEELALFQAHAGTEFTEGLLSDKFKQIVGAR